MKECTERDVLSVTTTVDSMAAAQALAREILERRLAACVQLEGGLVSLYRWQGALREEPEVRLVIKTLPACEAGLLALFAERHPYQLPQFLTVRMQASEPYLEWAGAEVATRR